MKIKSHFDLSLWKKLMNTIFYLLCYNVCFFIFSCSFFESHFSIKGTISNFDDFITERAIIQLVPVESENGIFKIKEMKAVRDIANRIVEIELPGNFPKQNANKNFTYKSENIKPGFYVLMVNIIFPKLSFGEYHIGPPMGSALATFDLYKQPIILEISDNSKSPISIDLGETIILKSNKIIFAEFENSKIIKK